MSNIVAEWYEEKKNVDEMQNWNSALKEWEQSVIKFFPSGARILDIVCGLGREAFALSDLGYDVVGIDISKEVISQVKQLSVDKGYNISFYECDGGHLDCCMETNLRKVICQNANESLRMVDYAVFQHTIIII